MHRRCVVLLASVALASAAVSIQGLPGSAEWKNTAKALRIGGNGFSIEAGKSTDWYISPVDRKETATAPILLFNPASNFVLSTKVSVGFKTQWDAGALFVYADERNWAKFALEMAVYKKPTIVTVVTRGVSDDCNSWSVDGNSVWLKIARTGDAFGFYASRDGRDWEMIRAFTFGHMANVRVGFSAQSPVGAGAAATFSDVNYAERQVGDIFTGE